jgi:serine phosphatase RsbU (regulator of sigma subunit)
MIAGNPARRSHMFPRLRRGPAPDRPDKDSIRHLLLGTLPGRVLVVGGVVRLLAAAAQAIVGQRTIIDAIGAAGTIALLAALAYFVWRIAALAKGRLLWRVRRRLILSYIFVGLVPVLLVIAFFALCGLLLFTSVSSYVVQTRLRGLVEQTQYLARTAAIDLAHTAPDRMDERLASRQQAIRSRYPGASMAAVPVARRCGDENRDAARAANSTATLRRLVAVGPWTHVSPPDRLPDWITCSGFSGLMAYWAGSAEALAALQATQGAQSSRMADDSGNAHLFVRAVAMPETPTPGFAVVVDIPISELVALRLRGETGIELRGTAVIRTDTGVLPMQGHEGGAPADTSSLLPGRGLRSGWVVFLDYTDWLTGKTGAVALGFGMRVGEIYERLAPSRAFGSVSFGQVLMLAIVVVGSLFLVIQFVALVMGLALARSITGSVHELFVGTERVRQGDFSHKIQVHTRDQLGELADSFNTMTGRLGQLLAEMAEKKRLEEELRIARAMQMSLLPQSPPQLPGMRLTALCAPAREVGGDYYDFLPIDERRMGLLIADVSGKGTSAAFYMAELKGLMLSLSQIHRSPRELLIAANRIIGDNLDNRSFITMTYAVLDLEARTMTWARAGHTPLIHVPGASGDRRARVLVTDGMVLGLKLDAGERFTQLLEETTIHLESGDLFMFFTDGLSEQMNLGEELFGEARLGALIEEHGHLPFDELRERIVREVKAFAGEAAQHDDMTFILLRVDTAPARSAPAEQTGEVLVS